jgi:non-ribosomal peptide synthetase component E (peptide arylation enzyme)
VTSGGNFSFEPLTPLHFLERSARVYPTRTAVVDGDRRFTDIEFRERVRKLAGGLRRLGVESGNVLRRHLVRIFRRSSPRRART